MIRQYRVASLVEGSREYDALKCEGVMPETYEIKGCPIFQVGTWNGDVYSEADLDHMVAAFNQVGFQPPMKLGHDESQALAKNDGMPAIGWVTNLRRTGAQLYCDIRDLPKKVYEAIKRKNYNRVSAEVYWDYSCNGRKWPRVLKALSLLGADIPAVTSIAALETLYDGEGQSFKRYDMGMLPMPCDSVMPLTPQKAKLEVGYRQAEDGGLGRCGACKFFQGPPDPLGKDAYIACCALVSGEIATTWVCDLWEAREAFSSMAQKDYTIEQRGDKWVLLAKGSGEVLGTHGSKEDAEAQEQAIQASKAKEHSEEKPIEKPEIKSNKSDAVAKERRYMEIKEIDGEFCVMKDGEKMKCFATKEEADAYQVSLMAQSAAEVKALKQKLEASEKLNKDLSDKISSLDQLAVGLTAKFAELEERTKTAETEATSLKEQNRKVANEAWLSEMGNATHLKVLPWEQPYVAFVLDHMTGGQVKTYADNGADITPAEAFKKLYEQRKPGTDLIQELSSGGATKEAVQLEKREYASLVEARKIATDKTKEYMKEHPEIKQFSVAFKAVLDKDADLKAAVSGVTVAGAQKAQDGADRMQRFFKS